MTDRSPFVARHIGPDDADLASMLKVLGYDTLDALVADAVPAAIADDAATVSDWLETLGPGMTEEAMLDDLRSIAAANEPGTSLIGMGYHGTFTPEVLRRNLLENPAWYTAYTPYQPEISQGRLEVLLTFQTMIADLCGLDLAGASLLDESTAAAEAMTLLRRVSSAKADRFVVDSGCHPQTIAVVRTRAEPLGIPVELLDPRADGFDASTCFGVLLQNPTTTGRVHDDTALIASCHSAGALVAVVADLLALVLMRSPGEMGADVVVGSAQRFGVPMGFGGPHAGFMAVRDAYRRSMPGRLVGTSVDAAGRPAHRLALQTREQHIRREKATSNICTAQVLLAEMAAMYACWHGPDGLRAIAERVTSLAEALAQVLAHHGVDVLPGPRFDTVCITVPGQADEVCARAATADLWLRRIDADTVSITFDETSTIETVANVACRILDKTSIIVGHGGQWPCWDLRRTDEILTAPVFHRLRSETEMMRELRRLADRDLALDRTMIPLGSCTMKLNAAAEMAGITWPGFADVHPFAPPGTRRGYDQLIGSLERMLCDITGYAGVSLQPNAGSQGELAGLLAIRAWHLANGQDHRDVCLIPSSAHGTNAASAVMAGMRVVVVECDDSGNIDLDDLRAKADEHAADLSVLMVTYPSTHGVYEEEIVEVCAQVHSHGGQVYLDGANLNALVGVARPGAFGSDVSHLNLHKTFCIPHGGGGPGVGPVAVAEHLVPFLPSHPVVPVAEGVVGPVSGAPWGSAGILPIPWAYITMMGGPGLLRATQVAIASANYLARRLSDHFPILYTGHAGLVAHECILDLRPLTRACGVTADDVTKRLIDFGFHAPTVSFPVAGTLMIEPTESESLAELDRFVDAMVAIKGEIDDVLAGTISIDDSPLRHAPHTAADLLDDSWARAYPRSVGAYGPFDARADKYWPPVSRIDAAYGDRNLVCACPALDDYR